MAVSAARSLAAAGVQVHGAGSADDPLRWSRACAAFTVVPSGPDLGARYFRFLESGPRCGVVLPCDDAGLEMIARHGGCLRECGYLPVELDPQATLTVLDKDRTYEVARRAGVPAPETCLLREPQDVARAAGTLAFPCGVKPVVSHHHGLALPQVSDKVYVVHDEAELWVVWRRLRAAGVDVLATEIVPGPDSSFVSYYTYVQPDGSRLFDLTKHKLRQLPIRFGLTCYQETVHEPEVVEAGRAFCEAVGLRGIAAVEFKRDARDGRWKIIECNGRITLAIEIVRLAGVDVPMLAYRRAAGLPVRPVDDYRDGVRMLQPIEDARAFLQYRRAGELTTGGWLRSLACRWHVPMFRWDDPVPSLRRLALTRVPNLARTVRGAARPSVPSRGRQAA